MLRGSSMIYIETQLNDCIGERCKEDAAKLPLYTDFFRCDARPTLITTPVTSPFNSFNPAK